MKILVADDNPVVLAFSKAALRYHGHTVVTASDGLQAWELLQQHDGPEVAVLDWEMPGLSGIEISTLVRQSRRPVYLVMLTAKDKPEDQMVAINAGVDAYLTKPTTATRLWTCIEEAAQRPRRTPGDLN